MTLKSRLKVTQGHWKQNRWIDHTRLTYDFGSLKLIPFESLGAVSYSPSIVTMAAPLAVSEIFSLKEWPGLEIWVWDYSASLKMVPFDRPCSSYYWSAIVTIALCCTIFELLDSE